MKTESIVLKIYTFTIYIYTYLHSSKNLKVLLKMQGSSLLFYFALLSQEILGVHC